MIFLFTNPNLSAASNITEYNTDAGCEYALGVLGAQYDLAAIASTDRKFFYSIEHQFPSWLVKESKTDSDIKIIELVQKYYDWIFSTSGLDVYPNYEDIQNIFYTNFTSIKETYKSLFVDFDFDDFGEDYDKELREFLISNKKRFIVNKGNQDSFKYFIQTFFDSVLDDYDITFGVKNTMVLNQGNLNDDYLTEGRNRQEFAIILTAYIPEKYQDDFISLMKPIGFNFDLIKGEQNSVANSNASETFKPSALVL